MNTSGPSTPDSKWLHLELKCEPAEPGHDIATALLSEAGFSMFEHKADALHAYGTREEIDLAAAQAAGKRLTMLGKKVWNWHEVEDKNWNAEWERGYDPVVVSSTLRVRATFHQPDPNYTQEIIIQPQMAFGTGHHETTRGVLSMMEAMDWQGLNVLDMGCGSGVLAIYAKLRGASEVWAVDIDDWCTRNTQENVVLNACGPVRVKLGGSEVLETSAVQMFDVLLANINRNILTRDVAAYCKVLRPGAVALFSGFFPADVPVLEQAFAAEGLQIVSTTSEGDWCILKAKFANG